MNNLQLIKHLKGVWLENLNYNLRMCLGDLGKGWFNINQRKYEYYEIAKLLRMMELVKHIMQVSGDKELNFSQFRPVVYDLLTSTSARDNFPEKALLFHFKMFVL